MRQRHASHEGGDSAAVKDQLQVARLQLGSFVQGLGV